MNVRHVRVGDVLRMARRRLSPDPASTYRQIGIYSWGKGIIENPSISGAELSKVTYYRFPADALILSNIQAWEAAIAVSEKSHAEQFIASQRFLPYVPINDGEVDTRYLLHFFLSDSGMVLIRKASPGTVTRNRTLGIKAFENLKIPLPLLEKQRSIASRLDSIIATARHGGSSRALQVRAALAERIISEAYEYSKVPIGSVLRPARKWMPLVADATYRAIGVRSFGRGLIKYPAGGLETLSKLRYYEVPTNSLIVSNIKAWEGAVAIAKQSDSGMIASNRFLCYQSAGEGPILEFVLRYLLSVDGVRSLGRASPGSADRNRTLSIDSFEKLEIPFPPEEVQRKLISSLNVIDELGAHERRKQQLLAALPQAARNEVFARLV